MRASSERNTSSGITPHMTQTRSTHRLFMATATAMAIFTLMSMGLAVHFAPNAKAAGTGGGGVPSAALTTAR